MSKAGLPTINKTVLQLEEIECASCVKVVEKALLQLQGVKEARVNFASAKVYVEFNPEGVTVEKLIKAAQDAGNSARAVEEETIEPQAGQRMEKLNFRVEGMSCAACAARVEKELAGLKGGKKRE